MECFGLALVSVLGFSVIAAASPEEIDAQVAKAKEAIQTIEKNQTLNKSEFSVDPHEPGGVSVTRFTNNKDELQKVNVKSVGKYGKSDSSFYFKEGELFAMIESEVFQTFVRGKDENGQDKMKDVALEREMFFSGEKCVRYTLKKAESPEKDGAAALLAEAETKIEDDQEREDLYLKRARDYAKITSLAELEAFLKG